MRILIFSWRGPGHPNAGGAEIVTHEHAKGWIKAGHSVTLFTSTFTGAKSEEIVDGVNILRAGSQTLGVHLAAIKWYIFGIHQRYDLIIDQFHGIPFFAPLFVRQKKLGFIHEVTKELWKLNPWPKPLYFIPLILGSLFEPLVFRILYRTIPFMTVSESTKIDLVSWGIPKENIMVVYNGVNIPRIRIYPKEYIKTLIYLGAISKDKGIEDALKIFSTLNIKRHWQFWVVGKSEPKYLKFLKKQSEILGIDRILKFWGYVDENKKYELLSRAYILVNPSIREGWGLVVIEAARMGTPTVSFDVPGLRDSISDGKTGLIDKQNSIKSISEKIIDLINDKKRYQKMRKEAIVWGRKFSWEKSSKESLRLIEKISGK